MVDCCRGSGNPTLSNSKVCLHKNKVDNLLWRLEEWISYTEKEMSYLRKNLCEIKEELKEAKE